LYHNQVKSNDFHHKDEDKLSIKEFLILKELLDFYYLLNQLQKVDLFFQKLLKIVYLRYIYLL